ncbi:hypothetical protein [Methylopila sp. M107]|uniref:hypothetical protein n=1 Tax=Methylopila sp. M107 TaxID=1101190 RepID=UPI0012DF7660|nr:hypothetical protein [Methylopila sp. M107]
MTTSDATGARAFGLSRWSGVTLAALGLAVALAGALAYRALTEAGGSNSYALLADAFLHGRFDSPTCFDIDCARYMQRIFVIFPPVPALFAMPLVALFGPDTSGFLIVSGLLLAGVAWTWSAIGERLGLMREARIWTTAAFVFGTPAFYVTLRGDDVWFFAQIVGLLLVSLAVLASLDRRLWLAGALIGLAFLSRQMTLLLAPFLFALSRPQGSRLIAFDRATILDALKIGLPLAAALGVYFAYNWARFGSPLDTGYGYIAAYPDEARRTFITFRMEDIGLFSKDYLLFNALHLFVQGFHAEFGGRYMTELVRMDPMGTSLFAASPFLLFAFYARRDARLLAGALVIAAIAGVTLFYHSNGFAQHNVQRYALDWLPALYLLLLPALAGASDRVDERLKMFKLLAVYAFALNVVAFGIAGVTKGAI